MNMKSWMKKFVLALLSGLLVFTGCKDDDDTPQGDSHKLISSQVIGPDGGSIISENVMIEIPAGELTEATTIELYSSSTENPYGDDGNSDVFWLSGIDNPLDVHFRISIRYHGALTDQSFICLGKYVIATSGQDTTLTESLLPATDSSGFVQAYTNFTDKGNQLKTVSYSGRYGFPLFSMTGYWYYQTDHFMVHFPGRYKSTGVIESLADGLEGAYDTLHNMGFEYTNRTSWPVEVTVKQLPPDVNGQTDRSFPWMSNSGYIEISTDIMNDKPLVKITGAHEFFHIVQDLYNYQELYNWLQESSSVWFEEKFSANPSTYISDARAGLQMEPFSGLQAGATGSGIHHGYGCSAVIKYAVSQYGQGIIKKIWEYCRDGEHPVSAIKLSTDPYVIWYINFMREYLMGNVYNDDVIGQCVYNDKFTISSDQDVQKSFTRDFPDLSAYAFIVEPKNSNFTANSKLQLSLTGEGRSMYVIKKTGSVMSSIGYDVNQLTIPDLKGLQSSGSTLYVLVTNYNDTPPGYTAISSMGLTMNVVNSGNEYINDFTSKTDAIGVCGEVASPYFLTDITCKLTSASKDFRVEQDTIELFYGDKLLMINYPAITGNETHTLHVNVNMQNLRKNPGGGVTWDPNFFQGTLSITDMNGTNNTNLDGSGDYSFDIVYDKNNRWPFATIYLTVKESQGIGSECNSNVFQIALYDE